jgi:ankyrin repeat protein
MTLDKKTLKTDSSLTSVFTKIIENRITEWESEGHIGEKYVQYKIKNGLFTYHVNKEQRPFPLKDQKYCTGLSWGPKAQKFYYDAVDHALALIKKGVNWDEKDKDGNNAFLLACLIGEPRLIKVLQKNPEVISHVNNNGEHALHLLVKSGRLDGLHVFLKNNKAFNSHVVDHFGWSALHHLVEVGDDVELFKVLERLKIDASICSSSEKSGFPAGSTASDIAKAKSRTNILPFLNSEKIALSVSQIREMALKGNISVLEKHLKDGGDAELIDEQDGSSLIIDIARNSHAIDNSAEMISLLLKHGANINALQKDNFNALMICINSLYNKGKRILAFDREYMEHVKIAKVLIEAGINLRQAKKGSLQKALRDAAEISAEITEMLVNALSKFPYLKEELNYQDTDGFTAMHTGVRSGNLQTVKLLVNAGANINIPEAYGFIPLHEAIIAGNYDMAKYLIDNGADVKHTISRPDGAYKEGDDAKAIASKSRNKDILTLFA